jgi:GntR family transcriptional regulator / MocR family aminotransferase
MHIAAVSVSVDLERVAEALLDHNVKIHSLSRYFLGPQTQAGLIFGLGTVDLADIRRGMSVLRKAVSTTM